jgi:hypothetical protein
MHSFQTASTHAGRQEKTYVVVDSRFRDKTKYPNANSFVVNLDTVLKNVVSIELVYAIYDTLGTERYINLVIPEVRSFLVSNNNVVEGAFTQLPLLAGVNEYTSQKFKSICEFDAPIAKLSRLTLNLVGESGGPYPVRDFFMRFEIVWLKHV